MHRDLQTDQWTPVCRIDEILPDTGVCALVKGEQVAVFRVGQGADQLYAIANYDPNSGAAVLSRGLVGSIGERIVVASPIYKQHFDLRTGECLEAPAHSVGSYPVRVADGKVWVGA
jgi:nitrite reductase (NADH) small subunit